MSVGLFDRSLRSDFFLLDISFKSLSTQIVMKMLTNSLLTSSYPATVTVLDTYLPSIYKSRCFNPLNLPFKKEVENTEIGHLFEHILLEYMSIEHRSLDLKSAPFSGYTSWNWKQDSRGTFHIKIKAGRSYMGLLESSIVKSVEVLSIIMGGMLLQKHTVGTHLQSANAIVEAPTAHFLSDKKSGT